MQSTEALKKYFGYSEFHPMQEGIINNVLAGRDVFVLMPTGSGKSLCYQLPAIMKDGTTVVVSPLIALMKDQVDSLVANGIGASFINSSLGAREIEDTKTKLLENKVRILYIAPERLASTDFIYFMRMLKISLFAIDEAHCISEWGHDFRPEYRKLSMLREIFPRVPIIALTATAIPDVQKDIVQNLKLRYPKIYKTSFNRPNLFYYVQPKEDAYSQILNYIQNHPKDSGIIYCQSRNSSESLARMLQEDGFRALPYHAGLSRDERTENQERFLKDDAEIIVATIAFGMGINKPNVRYVMHYDIPKNIEGYYQETGRAGRDRLDSDCILFFSYGDRKKIEILIEKSKNPQKKAIAYRKLNEMIKFCESFQCRRKFLLEYFGEMHGGHCGKCDTCLTPRETIDGTEAAKKVLACIKEINQRFGMNYVISILTGTAKGRRIPAYGHDKISSYGTGKEYSRKQWQSFIREIAQQGFIDVAGDKYPVLKLNQKSSDVLSGKISVQLTKPKEKALDIIHQEKAVADMSLFDMLRALRKRMADSENVPPYIIFPDITLREMATYYPQNIEAMKKIRGVGDIKLEKYSKPFLELIIAYCKEHDIEQIKIEKKRLQAKESDTHRQTLGLVKQGLSMEEIAEKRGLIASTIATHIEKLILSGADINIEKFVTAEKQHAIYECMKRLGTQSLTPLKENLGDGYSYDEIRLARAKLAAEKNRVRQDAPDILNP
ncbi:MAG: DNA helicase RecQ [Candidatus Aenigmarchaeota archaeon]|nr:DNA helicase RecQ [Candidatus Aenigmarchaeota archaeon]MDI6722637.1 DNA helicase RecQ [Candidatus Aenigmarchaeota archaeon]